MVRAWKDLSVLIAGCGSIGNRHIQSTPWTTHIASVYRIPCLRIKTRDAPIAGLARSFVA